MKYWDPSLTLRVTMRLRDTKIPRSRFGLLRAFGIRRSLAHASGYYAPSEYEDPSLTLRVTTSPSEYEDPSLTLRVTMRLRDTKIPRSRFGFESGRLAGGSGIGPDARTSLIFTGRSRCRQASPKLLDRDRHDSRLNQSGLPRRNFKALRFAKHMSSMMDSRSQNGGMERLRCEGAGPLGSLVECGSSCWPWWLRGRLGSALATVAGGSLGAGRLGKCLCSGLTRTRCRRRC